MTVVSDQSAGPGVVTGVERSRSSPDGGRLIGSGRVEAARVEMDGLEVFAVEVHRHDDVAIVQPRGELDLATVETLRTALDGTTGARRLVLDLRGLSFIDSTGLTLLVALDHRAQRDGFQLTLFAPAAPVNRTIQLCGLDEALPFAAAVDVVDSHPVESASGP